VVWKPSNLIAVRPAGIAVHQMRRRQRLRIRDHVEVRRPMNSGGGPFRLGVEHGVWCVGCCVGLMVVLVLAASMSLAAAAIVGGVVFVQKVLPLGETTARLTGAVLLASAAVVTVALA